MKLIYPEYAIELPIKENQVIILSVENPKAFANILSDLWHQINGKEGGFLLSEIDKEKNIAKSIDFIVNPFELNCNDRKVVTKVYQELSELAMENLYDETSKLNEEIIKYIEKLIGYVPYHLDYNLELDLNSLMKSYHVELTTSPKGLLEQIVEYLRVMHQICGVEIFAFVGLKQFLSKEELKMLYEFAFYEKVYLIILEGKFIEKNENEKCWILDKDLCIIEVN